MSRNNKARRQEKKRIAVLAAKARHKQWQQQSGSRKTAAVLERAAALAQRKEYVQARHLLDFELTLDPDNIELLQALGDICQLEGNVDALADVCRRLIELDPDNPSAQLLSAGAMVAAGRPASALLAFRRFLEQHGDDPLAESVSASIQEIEQVSAEVLQDFPFSGDERIEFAADHEELVACVKTGDWPQVIALGEQLQSRCPDFVPTLNNLAEAYFREGRVDDAVAASRSALERAPDDVRAMGNLARHLFLLGKDDEAADVCAQLRAARSERGDFRRVQAETCMWLGDDAGVLEALAAAERAGAVESSPDNAMLYHLGAVASARQGNDNQAADYWRKSLELWPDFPIADENFSDAEARLGVRDGLWPFGFDDWGPEAVLEELRELYDEFDIPWTNRAPSLEARQFASDHPEFVGLIPAVLDRGDPMGREMALSLAMDLNTPETMAALKDFAFSTRGPDDLRLRAVDFVCRNGGLPCAPAKLWIKGSWQESVVFGFEIGDKPDSTKHYDPGVKESSEAGYFALMENDAKEAERLFQKCIAVQGETPEFLQNLATAYQMQHRDEEYRRLINQIHERWPDYSFARIGLSFLATHAGDYEKAESLLAPVLAKRRLHVTEFISLAPTCIQLYLATNRLPTAWRWFGLWRDYDPRDMNLVDYAALIWNHERTNSPGKFQWIRDRS